MGVQIQPVSIWYNGQSKQASELDARIIFDDLSKSAMFCYDLKESGNNPSLSSGEISMDGQDYIDWDNSNEAAYIYIASKLNLTII
jgi:hypothetical protein